MYIYSIFGTTNKTHFMHIYRYYSHTHYYYIRIDITYYTVIHGIRGLQLMGSSYQSKSHAKY